jgi:hypothetical protein
MSVWQRLFAIGCFLLLAGCSSGNLISQPTETNTPTPTVLPSPTSVPLAALVNDEPIPLEEYNLEVARFERAQATLGVDLSTLGDYAKRVLNSMIEERVAAQAAKSAGLAVPAGQVDTTYQAGEQARGGADGMQTWLKDNLYTEASFREALARQILVQMITSQIADQTPRTADQVRARHILVSAQATAEYLVGLINQGTDFAKVAKKYSQDLSTRDNGGDLGWFARGTLLSPEVETAAFALDVDQMTQQPVQTQLGFEIIKTLAKESNRPLSPAAYELLRRKSVQTWVAGQVAQAKIQILMTTAS